MLKNKKIFITGGAGFIGSEISKILNKNNELYIYDNFSRNAIRYTDLDKKNNIHIEEGDILDYIHLKSSINNFQPQIVLHLAAIAGITTVTKKPVHTMQVNMIGTYNILESLLLTQEKLERFVDISTSEIFGSYAYKLNEKSSSKIASVGEARWTYSTSKLAAEHLTYAYHTQYGYPVTTIRPFNIYGSGQIGEGAIHQFVMKALKNEIMQIHGEGDQIRSWCYISDFIDAMLLILENENAIGETFNIGNPKGTITISMLAYLIKIIANSKSNIEYIPKNYEDVELRVPSIDKAKEILAYNPKVDLQDGLKNTIEWYKKIYK